MQLWCRVAQTSELCETSCAPGRFEGVGVQMIMALLVIGSLSTLHLPPIIPEEGESELEGYTRRLTKPLL